MWRFVAGVVGVVATGLWCLVSETEEEVRQRREREEARYREAHKQEAGARERAMASESLERREMRLRAQNWRPGSIGGPTMAPGPPQQPSELGSEWERYSDWWREQD